MKAENKFNKVMHEFGQGKLKSHDRPITNQKQAIAIAFSEARKINPTYGVKGRPKQKFAEGSELYLQNLKEIYASGTAKQLWDTWDEDQRIHFLMDHATEFFELMGDDFYNSAQSFSVLSYDTLPEPIRKSIVIHHAQGIYKEGSGVGGFLPNNYKGHTANQIWNEWNESQREHFIADHKNEIIKDADKEELEEYEKHPLKAEEIGKIKYSQLPSFMKRGIDKHINMGQYPEGGPISKKLSPAKKKLQARIKTLKKSMASANTSAQKSIQKRIDKLQKQFDYNPSAKERAMSNKGKFAMDVPASYSKAIYKKLWSLKILPRIHKLNGTHSIVVNSKTNLDKAYKIYSDILKQDDKKSPALSKISRKL